MAGGLILVAWLVLGHYTRRQHVSGTLVPQTGVINITARAAGVVTYVATEGKYVNAGEEMVSVSGEHSSSLNRSTFEQISLQLGEEEQNIKRQMEMIGELTKAQENGYHNQQIYLKKQLIELIESEDVVTKQERSFRNMLTRESPLIKKGYISQLQAQQQQAHLADLDIQKKNLRRQKYDLSQQIEGLRSQIEQLPMSARQHTAELRRQLTQLEESRVQNESTRTALTLAPVDGTAAAPLVKLGQTVAPGQPVISLIPQGAPLDAEFFVPSTAIGFIKPGTSVSLHLLTFPYQKFGAIPGIVQSISRSALSPTEVASALGGPSPNISQYRLVISLSRQNIIVYGKIAPLKPGMECEGDILLDRRSFLGWLLEPIEGLKRK